MRHLPHPTTEPVAQGAIDRHAVAGTAQVPATVRADKEMRPIEPLQTGRQRTGIQGLNQRRHLWHRQAVGTGKLVQLAAVTEQQGSAAVRSGPMLFDELRPNPQMVHGWRLQLAGEPGGLGDSQRPVLERTGRPGPGRFQQQPQINGVRRAGHGRVCVAPGTGDGHRARGFGNQSGHPSQTTARDSRWAMMLQRREPVMLRAAEF